MLQAIATNPIFAFVILVGLVVFFHEFGHFIVGRLLGVAVEEFSIGFGPKAYGFKRGETEYKICWLPLGGYVRFYGANLDGEIPPARRDESILTTQLHKRVLISAAGPAANFVLSLVVMLVLSGIGIPMPSARVAVMSGKPAAAAGIQSGDRVVTIEGEKIRSWKDLTDKVSANPGVGLRFGLERPGQSELKYVQVTPESEVIESSFGDKVTLGRIGVTQFFPTPRFVKMQDGLETALGFETGDEVVSIGDTKVRFLHDFLGALDRVWETSGPLEFAKHIHDSAATQELKLPPILVRRAGAEVELSPNSALLSGWANSLLQARVTTPDGEVPHWSEVFLTTDLLIADPSALDTAAAKGSSDRAASSSAAQSAAEKEDAAALAACGLVPGVALRAASVSDEPTAAAAATATVGAMTSPVDLSIVLRDLSERNNSSAAPRSVGQRFQIVDTQGALRWVDCQIPLRVRRDHLNRNRAEVSFPLQFATSGIAIEQIVVRSESWMDAPLDAVHAVREQAGTIFVGLKKLVTGSIPLANLGGPIQIARVAGSAAEGGLILFFLTVSWMSINIGMFNLLPLPALDGGALLMQGVEAAYGRPLPLSVQHLVQRVGVIIILVLIALVFYNDILRMLGGR
jgi:membrane-associated protease RseP (regulator of RpoE activity)